MTYGEIGSLPGVKRLEYLESEEDIQWFRETHAAEWPSDQVTGVVVNGNLDAPTAAWYAVSRPILIDTEWYTLAVKA